MKRLILLFVILICSLNYGFGNKIKYKQYVLGMKLYLKGDYASAVKEFNRLIKFSDVRSGSFLKNSSNFVIGMAFYELKNFSSALEYFKQVRDGSRGTEAGVVAGYWYVATLQQLGRLRSALYHYNLFLKKNVNHSLADDALYGIGLVYFRAERYEKSREKFQAVLDYYPKSGKADATEAMVMFLRIMEIRLNGFQSNGITVLASKVSVKEDELMGTSKNSTLESFLLLCMPTIPI